LIKSKKDIFSKNTIIYDNKLSIWFKSKNIELHGDKIKLKDLFFSSCCIDNPDWYIYAKKGSYNKKTKYVKLYNLVLYIDKTPVFYFPFYFNSLNKQRRSGLLRPYIGFSSKEGFLFTQPIYVVLGQRADIEFDPTIRTKRGRGIYSTFRFVDSPNSYGEIKLGEFIDYDSYFKEYDLAYKKHYGFEFYYLRKKLISSKDTLYINLKYANDVDYFYLNPFNYRFDTKYLVNKIITSKINFIYPIDNKYIFGSYFKYFIDTSKLSNADTLQILPQLNFHKFERKNIFLNSFDLNFYNYYSDIKRYYEVNLFLPISWVKKFFNNYLNIKLTQAFIGDSANFYDSNKQSDVFLQAFATLELYSSLIKKNSYLHIINPSIRININEAKYLKNNNNLLSDIKIDNSLTFNLFQILEKNDFYFDHTLTQTFYLSSDKKNDLENRINLKKGNFSVNLQNKFSWDENRVIYNAFSFLYSGEKYLFKLTHLYKYDTINENIKTVTLRGEKSLNKYKRLYVEYSYDILNNYNKYILFGTKLNKKCWKYDISFKRNRIPMLKESGISFRDDYIFSINVDFNPIGGLRQSILFH